MTLLLFLKWLQAGLEICLPQIKNADVKRSVSIFCVAIRHTIAKIEEERCAPPRRS